MDKLINKPFEVIINYEWRESLQYRRHGDDNQYSEYESYFYTIFENEKEVELKKHFERINTQDPFETTGIDYFLQFIPADINRIASNSGMTKSPSVKEQKKVTYLTKRLNEKYSIEDKVFFSYLNLTSTTFSSLTSETFENINFFLRDIFIHDSSYLPYLEKSKIILLVTYHDEIISLCCVTEFDENTYSETLGKIGETRSNLAKHSIAGQLTICATKEEYRNKGIMKTILNLLLRNFFYSKKLCALTEDNRMKAILQFLGFQVFGKSFKSRRTFNYNFYLLEPGQPDYGRMMYEIY